MKRKLPPYAELRRLIVDQGVSYRDIADRYGVANFEAVRRTFKRDALAHGESWPIERNWHKTMMDGVKETVVDATVIAELVRDAYWESEHETVRAFGEAIGVGEPYLSRLFNGLIPRISKPMAVRLLRAIGEEPHPSIANWKPRNPPKVKQVLADAS